MRRLPRAASKQSLRKASWPIVILIGAVALEVPGPAAEGPLQKAVTGDAARDEEVTESKTRGDEGPVEDHHLAPQVSLERRLTRRYFQGLVVE
jgi:hypothetical protein